MKGLLLKDFYIIKNGLIVLVAMLLFIGTGISIVVDPWVFIIIAATMLSMQSATTIISDKTSNWNMFSATVPLSKKAVFSSKYLLNFILSLVGLLIGSMISTTISLFSSSFDLQMLCIFICFGVVISLMPSSVNIPLSILFDTTKQTIGMLISYTITVIVITLSVWIPSLFINLEENILLMGFIAAVISLIIYIASWLIAPSILSKRDI